MQLFSVVKHLDVFKRQRLRFLARLEAFAMYPLVLEAAESAIRRRVDAPYVKECSVRRPHQRELSGKSL